MSKLLSGVGVGDVYLDRGDLHRLDRIPDGHRRMGVGAGVDDDARCLLPVPVDVIDQCALRTALEAHHLHASLSRGCDDVSLDVGEGRGSIHLRISLPEEVQVRPMDQQDQRSLVHAHTLASLVVVRWSGGARGASPASAQRLLRELLPGLVRDLCLPGLAHVSVDLRRVG
jgi:hypothetical protein